MRCRRAGESAGILAAVEKKPQQVFARNLIEVRVVLGSLADASDAEGQGCLSAWSYMN
jgi:hypothetical protein